MATLERSDLMEGSIEYFGTLPETMTRVFWVSDIQGNVSTKGTASWFADVMTVVPPILSSDPQFSYMVLGRHRIQPIGPYDAKVYADYFTLGSRRYTLSGSLETVLTDKDKNGVQVVVDCVGSTSRPIPANEQRQTGVMSLLRPMEMLTVSYYDEYDEEAPSENLHPRILSAHYLGKVNSTAVTLDAALSLDAAYAPGTLMCESINTEFMGGGGTYDRFVYRIEAGFRWKPSGWNPEVVYIDRRTGEPHPDIVSGTGRKIVTAYDTADLNNIVGGV